MAYTSDQLAAVESAIASGILTVRIGDRLTTYQSLDEMRKLRDDMRVELGIDAPAPRGAFSWVTTGKGY
ncbi:MAG: hypothetical protein KDJ24_16330 [Gammaproteobacteria bacterium]|nr:hypothetical protein [Gammaproteobacteria bacterium]